MSIQLSTAAIQNLVLVCKQLPLRTAYKAHKVLELPMMRTMELETEVRPAPNYEHKEAGLRSMRECKADRALLAIWGMSLRQLLQQPGAQKALMPLQLALVAVRVQVAGMASGLVAGAPRRFGSSAAPGSPSPKPRFRYFAISGKQWLQPVMAAVQPHIPEQFHGQLRKDELHVTLWHKNDPVLGADEQLRDALAAAQGQTVRLRVVAVYHSPEVSCAEVELLGGAPDAARVKTFPHLTLRTAKGVAPKSSNQLPARFAIGDKTVTKVVLQQPLVFEGLIKAVK